MYFDEMYDFCLKHFSKFKVFTEINVINHDFHGVIIVFIMKIEKEIQSEQFRIIPSIVSERFWINSKNILDHIRCKLVKNQSDLFRLNPRLHSE